MKRARTGEAVVVHTATKKRPVDKQVVVVNQTFAANTQTNTLLYTAVYPCTLTGLMWHLHMGNTAVGTNKMNWAITVVKQGEAVNGTSTVDAATLYNPEQQMLAFGTFKAVSTAATVGTVDRVFEGKTKTMRKLMAGDTVYCTYIGKDQTGSMYGSVQFFLKT